MVRLVSIVILAGAFSSCGPTTPSNNGTTVTEPPEADDRRRAALSDIAQNAIVPSYEAFALEAAALAEASADWASTGNAADRAEAQTAWRSAMLAWEVAEVATIGPAGAMGTVVGGEDLRDEIYSWPTKNPCRVDQEIVEQAYEDAEAFKAENVNVRGLDALEYLLFQDGTTNQCVRDRSINADGSWKALDAEELNARRAAYAKTVSAGVAVNAEALVAAWKDGFAEEFAQAGATSETYASTQDALNATTDALFYLDGELKDMKLAEPAGILNCAESTCPDEREFVWEDISFEAIAANLDGALLIFTGGDGLGFDDLLVDAGQESLAVEMVTAMEAARDEARSKSGTMGELLASDREAVVALHTKLKAVTDLLKTQFISVLDLELPNRAEGDND